MKKVKFLKKVKIKEMENENKDKIYRVTRAYIPFRGEPKQYNTLVCPLLLSSYLWPLALIVDKLEFCIEGFEKVERKDLNETTFIKVKNKNELTT